MRSQGQKLAQTELLPAMKGFAPIIARDPTKKNAGNREISTAFLSKLPVENSPYSNTKAAETPAVGKIAEKSGTAQNFTKKQPPRFAAQNCAVKRGGRLCPLAGCDSESAITEANVFVSTSPCGV